MSQRGSKWLHTGPPCADARVRLICFPHGGGGARTYRAWSETLPQWIEVLPIAPPGRGARLREPAITDMASMRAQVAEAITPILDRPYAIFGHSVGALVAFEVATELQARGAPQPLRVFLSAYAAPQAARVVAPIHDQPDDVLLSFLQQLGHGGSGPALESELRDFVMESVRADFKLAELHRVAPEQQINAPLTVLGGSDDETVPVATLAGWSRHAARGFSSRLFRGSHFYTESERDELLRFVGETLAGDLEEQPRSLAFGQREDFPQEICLHEHFRAQAAQTPERTALVDQSVRLTFAELDQQSDMLARRFLAQGCGLDRLVAILMEPSADFVIAYLAALKAGGAYLPIPIATPDAAIADILSVANPVAVATKAAHSPRLPVAWRNRDRCTVLGEGWQHRLSKDDLSELASAPRPGADNLAYCVMSSGTTGQPKGILCPHRGAVNSYWWRYRHLPYDDGPYGDGEREACNVFFVWEALRPMLQGRPTYVISDDVIFDPRRLIGFLEKNRITRVLFTPSLLDQVLSGGGQVLSQPLANLRVVILNGEVVPAALAARFRERLPHVLLVNDYSISECHDVATLEIGAAASHVASRYLPVGRPMSNVNVYILDSEQRPVPMGTPGEVYVGGYGIARGYLNNEAETALRFMTDPFARDGQAAGDARMFRTGDIGRLLSDGQIEISGRSDFMIKLRGYSIVPGAIEAEIRAFAKISAAVVRAVEDEKTGQPGYLAAYVTGDKGAPCDTELLELRKHLKMRLPHYAIPRVIVPLDELPIDTSTGKVDRWRLPDPATAAAPARRSSDAAAPTAGKVAAKVTEIWRRVLAAASVGPDDNFFDLGGHSLLATEMTWAVEDELGVAIDVIDVFDHPTSAAYAAHVCRAGRGKGAGSSKRFRRVNKADVGEIAVIGMAGRFPAASNVEELWRLVQEGRSAVRRFDDAELLQRGVPRHLIADPSYIKAGAILEDVGSFDPRFWGLSEAEATIMDPQQRLFLECSWHALESAAHRPGDGDRKIGVFAGCYLPGYLIHHLGAETHLDAADPTRVHLAELGNDKDYLASRTAYLMNLCGPAIGVQTSCSTGLVAIAQATAALRDGQCEMALAGAASITFPQGGFVGAEGHIGTRSGVCRAFDAAADGTILGDGVGVVVLRRLDEALADGDTVLAVIKGYAVNNDGASKAGYSAPSAAGQAAVISNALDMADVPTRSIGYIEAHGSGTHLGDPIEVRGLVQAFRRQTDETGFCALGSIKPNIGHSNIAAGVAGFIKAVLAVRDGIIPPVANFTTANPELKLDTTPFRIPTASEAWSCPDGEPRRAGVSSFGIGGTNCHVILEQAPIAAEERPEPAALPVVLPVSAKTGEAAKTRAKELVGHLHQHPVVPLADAAATLQSGRETFRHRIAVSGTTHEAAITALSERLDGRCRAETPATADGGVAFVFPGHGAQYLQMGSGLYETNATFRQHFHRCAAAFAEFLERPLTDLFAAQACEELLRQPTALQAAIFSLDCALGRSLIDWGVKPVAVCGHSLGEYAAATIAGALTLGDAVRLVHARGNGTALCGHGSMLSLAAGEDAARRLAADIPGLALAAVNSECDAVVSGPLSAIEEAERRATQMNIAARRLAASYAFHSPSMRPAAEALEDACAAIDMMPPSLPLFSNLTGGRWGENETRKQKYWTEQMLSPVRFLENCKSLLAANPSIVLEVGPGRTLQRCLQRSALGVEQQPRIMSALGAAFGEGSREPGALSGLVAELWEAGIDIDWDAWRGGRGFRRIALPGYPFERRNCWPLDDKAKTAQPGSSPVRREARVPFEEMFHLPSWARTAGPAAQPAWQGHFFILSSADGPSAELAEDLGRQLGGNGSKIIPLRADPEPGAYRLAIARLRERLIQHEGPARVIDLSHLCTSPQTAVDTVAYTASLCEAFASLAPATSQHQLEYWLVTDGALQVTEEDFKPRVAPLIGPVLVAPQENPRLAVRLIDIRADGGGSFAGDPRQVRRLAEEVKAAVARREPLVALRGRQRWVERFEPLPIGIRARHAGIARLRNDADAHVITGGLGRIGLTIAGRLARLGCRVVLISRRGPPDPAWLQSQFGDAAELIRIESCDVANGPQFARVLQDIAHRDGGIGGVFHCAGLADLRYLEDTSAETIAAEAASKILGTDNLRMAVRQLAGDTGGMPSFIMLFSSLASVLGGLGMAGYAAANRLSRCFGRRHRGGRWCTMDFRQLRRLGFRLFERTSWRFCTHAEGACSVRGRWPCRD